MTQLDRRLRQVITLQLLAFVGGVVFLAGLVGGIGFELGRYLARVETPTSGIGTDE